MAADGDRIPAQAVLEHLPLPVAVLDAEDTLLWCNRVARSAWGDPRPGSALPDAACAAEPRALAGTGLRIVCEPDAEARLRALRRAALKSSAIAHDVKNAGTAVHLALRAVARALGEDEVEILSDLERRLRGVEERIRRALDGV